MPTDKNSEKKALVITWARNAEETLARTIASVLNQLHTNLEYIIIDNASTDGTANIIKKFVEQNSRITTWHNEENIMGTALLYKIYGRIRDMDYDYMCSLDADDEYHPNFLQDTITFAEENNCDCVHGGHQNIDSDTGQNTATCCVQEPIIFEGKDFAERFPEMYPFAGTHWGKVFSKKTLDIFDWEKYYEADLTNSADTLFSLMAFERLDRFGVIPGIRHNRYKYSTGFFRKFSPKRFPGFKASFDAGYNLINTKAGFVSLQSRVNLITCYAGMLGYVTKFLLESGTPDGQKLHYLHEMMTHQLTQELYYRKAQFSESDFSERLNTPITGWLSEREFDEPSQRQMAAEISDVVAGRVRQRFF